MPAASAALPQDLSLCPSLVPEKWAALPSMKPFSPFPPSQVATLAGDLYVAEVTVANDPDDDSKPFLEFMVTNKRGVYVKPPAGGKCTSYERGKGSAQHVQQRSISP